MVDIIIVTWNRLTLTRRCIESIGRHTRHPYRLFIADNGSSDGTREYLLKLREQGLVHRLLFFEENVGIAPALNSLWEVVDNPVVLRLDNDVEIYRDGWLTRLHDTLLRNPGIGILGFSFLKQIYGKELKPVRMESGDVLGIAPAIGGACMMFAPSVRKELGCWCEDYGVFGEEDTDICFRARKLGYGVFALPETDWMFHMKNDQDDTFDLKGYYAFKKRERKKNLEPLGSFSLNLVLYQMGLRPPTMSRRFRTILDPDGIRARIRPRDDYNGIRLIRKLRERAKNDPEFAEKIKVRF